MTAYAMTAPGMSEARYARAGRERVSVSNVKHGGSTGLRIRAVDTPVMRRRRRTTFAILLAVIAAVVGPQAFAGDDDSATAIYDTHTVAHGETLWSIAASVTPVGEDVRDVLADITRMNAIGGSTIQVGEQLRIPLVTD